MINIYNTLTKKKEPLEKKKIIKIYTCGVTVYDYCHIGHARIFLLFDSLIRYLYSQNIKIFFIRNITDVDDKIIKKSKERNIKIKQLTNFFIKKMHEDTKKLNIIEPTYEPKATTFIPEMINLIKILKKKKVTYKNNSSDILFKINKFNNYGKLSKQSIKNLKESYNKTKNNKYDFVLWKKNKKLEKIFWNSPWGEGRPGWHTECAAMIMYYIKNDIDLHGGGHDLLFPHHENELAQCESINTGTFVKLWMHIGQLKINKIKMSKKLNNSILIKDFLKNHNEEYLRFLILSSNYRKSINYSYETLKKIKKALNKLYDIKDKIKNEVYNLDKNIEHQFNEALNNDFNTQKAISILFKSLNNSATNNKNQIYYTIIKLIQNIGLLKYNKNDIIQKDIKNITKIKILIEKRSEARINKNWKIADTIRKKLINMNVKINDTKENTNFEII